MAVGARSIEKALQRVLGSGKGTPYSNSDTAVDDNPRRFEPRALKLRDAVIRVETNNQLIGGGGVQRLEMAAGASMGVSFLNLSQFYFRNATAGQNGTIQVFGTRH